MNELKEFIIGAFDNEGKNVSVEFIQAPSRTYAILEMDDIMRENKNRANISYYISLN